MKIKDECDVDYPATGKDVKIDWNPTDLTKQDTKLADEAFMVHTQIQHRTAETAMTLLELGRLFKKIRDDKLYEAFECGSFKEYCAMPEVRFARPTIYLFISCYEKYILKHGFKKEFLAGIGVRRLQFILPVVDTDPEEWVYKAKTLGEPDLINEVRIAQGKEEMIPVKKEKEDVYPFNHKDYKEFVKESPCLVCGDTSSEAHHFPKTRGAGGDENWVIPLCRKCHTTSHNDPYDFLWEHKDLIFAYFYKVFKACFALVNSLKE
jgi:hypothetical protein